MALIPLPAGNQTIMNVASRFITTESIDTISEKSLDVDTNITFTINNKKERTGVFVS